MAILEDSGDKEDSNQEKGMQLRVLSNSEIDVILREVKPKLDIVRTEPLRKILKGEVDESQIRKIGDNT